MQELLASYNNAKPPNEAIEAVNAAYGGQKVTLKSAKEYIAERRKTAKRQAARDCACPHCA